MLQQTLIASIIILMSIPGGEVAYILLFEEYVLVYHPNPQGYGLIRQDMYL